MGERAASLDFLIHSAGAIALGTLESAAPADLDRQWNINLSAPYLLTQALLPLLKRSRGQVVFINSSAGVDAVPGSGQYSATKHGLRALADSSAVPHNHQIRTWVSSRITGSSSSR